MAKLYDYAFLLFAVAGFWVGTTSPAAGAVIVVSSLALALGHSFVAQRELALAEEQIKTLAAVVNNHAAKIEELIVDNQKIQSDLAFNQTAKQMGMR